MKICRKLVQETTPFSEELKPLMALYLRDTVQKGAAVSYSPLKEMVRRYVEQKMKDNILNDRTEDRPQKETHEIILKAMHKKRSKIEQWRVSSMVLERTTFTRRFVQLQARRNRDVRRKRRRSVLNLEREDIRKETEKEISKRKDPKARQSNKSVCIHFLKGQRQT